MARWMLAGMLLAGVGCRTAGAGDRAPDALALADLSGSPDTGAWWEPWVCAYTGGTWWDEQNGTCSWP